MLGDVHEPAAKVRDHVLECLTKCVLEESGVDQLRSRPDAEKKRKEGAKRRRKIWLGGGLVSVSVAVAIGVGVLWGGIGKASGEVAVGFTTFLAVELSAACRL